MPKYARLNHARGLTAPATNVEFLEVNVGESLKIVTAVATQGHGSRSQWVKAYTLSYSEDGAEWFKYTEHGEQKVYHHIKSNRQLFFIVFCQSFLELFISLSNDFKIFAMSFNHSFTIFSRTFLHDHFTILLRSFTRSRHHLSQSFTRSLYDHLRNHFIFS